MNSGELLLSSNRYEEGKQGAAKTGIEEESKLIQVDTKLIMIDTTGNGGRTAEIEEEGGDSNLHTEVEEYKLRDQLPVLRDPNDRPGLWKILKSAIGKDITKFCVPVYMNEPISMI